METVHERLDYDITWACKTCDTLNVDNPAYTSGPMCSHCEKEYSWQDIGQPFCLCHIQEEYKNAKDTYSRDPQWPSKIAPERWERFPTFEEWVLREYQIVIERIK